MHPPQLATPHIIDQARSGPSRQGASTFTTDGRKSAWEASQHVRRESRHIFHRLASVYEDSRFVERVAAMYPSLPLTANLRCGAWYTPPCITSLVSYFKSTDGHMHQWSFSLKRPNLHLLPSLLIHRGCIIVDSTTRGKSMPDALSKTVPIWCSVLNAASLRRHGGSWGEGEWTDVEMYDAMVGDSEREQIKERVQAWVEALLRSDLEVPKLNRPLRPVFVTRETELPIPTLDLDMHAEQRYTPIILVSASKSIKDSTRLCEPSHGKESQERIYVQGAGDDHENWALGLTPNLFWSNRESLLAANKEELPGLVRNLVESGSGKEEWFEPQRRMSTSDEGIMGGTDKQVGKGGPHEIGEMGIFLSVYRGEEVEERDERGREGNFGLIIYCSAMDGTRTVVESQGASTKDGEEKNDRGPTIVHLDLRPGKRGASGLISRASLLLRSALSSLSASHRVLLKGTSYDHVSSAAILLLSLFYHDDTRLFLSSADARADQAGRVDKETTRKRLQWIVTTLPYAAPSRTYMLRINDCLIGARYRKQ